MTLETYTIIRSSFHGTWRPMSRWVQDLAIKDMSNNIEEKGVCLQTLFYFCKDTDVLPRAFLLASICREAISTSSIQLEERSYGNITSDSQTHLWDHLRRKLRVCLLISLRQHGRLTSLP